MNHFFESDQDELSFGDRIYVDFFNLYPDLQYHATLEHLKRVDAIAILEVEQEREGWRIEVEYSDIHFLVDTHFHGTSTLFCVEKGVQDEKSMLAFLGCFLPLMRDHWRAR